MRHAGSLAAPFRLTRGTNRESGLMIKSAAVVLVALRPWDSAAAVGAAVALPALDSFTERDGGYDQSRDGVGPPPAEKGVQTQPDQQRNRQVGAEHVLAALADRSG